MSGMKTELFSKSYFHDLNIQMWQPSVFFPHNEATTWAHFFPKTILCTLPSAAAKGEGHWLYLQSVKCHLCHGSQQNIHNTTGNNRQPTINISGTNSKLSWDDPSDVCSKFEPYVLPSIARGMNYTTDASIERYSPTIEL